jgi:uncharacterized membrane protein YgaE (UPF0421/DUF939 family)
MDSFVPPLREAGRRLRARARVTQRLQELSPVPAWRKRTWGDLLGLNRTMALRAGKVGLASALSWLVAHWTLGASTPIYAPLSAAFVGLVTVQTSVRDGAQRVIGVLVGIGVAALLAEAFGLHAWSIGIVVGLGFAVGHVLHMAEAGAAQIPVTGLLLLALGGASHPVDRVLETLIGAAVAIAVNVLVLPPNHVGVARHAVRSLADQVVGVLSGVAAGIAEPWTTTQAARWLRAAQDRAGVSSSAQQTIEDAERSLRMHPRRGRWSDVQQAVRRAGHTLGVVETQVRVLTRTLRDSAESLQHDAGSPSVDVGDVANGTVSPRTAGAVTIAGADSPVSAVADGERQTATGSADDDTCDGTDSGSDGARSRREDEEVQQPPLPMAADMLTSTAGAVEAFAAGMLPRGGSIEQEACDTARASIRTARACIARINADLPALVAANLPRGIYLGTLVVETGRILDELQHGLPDATDG